MTLINQSAIKGEASTGFERRGNKGPFECGNCHYFRDNSCGEENMMKFSKQPKLKNGRIQVHSQDCCEYVERVGNSSVGDRKVLFIRHGVTALDSHDPKKDFVTGWLDLSLIPEGRKESKEIAKELKDEKINRLFSSDLLRAKQTADIISGQLDNLPKIDTRKGLRCWDVGELVGQPSVEAKKTMIKYAEAIPDKPIPHGESFNTFKNRLLRCIRYLIEAYPKEQLVIVAHSHTEWVLRAWIAAGCPDNLKVDIDTFKDEGDPQGSVRTLVFPVCCNA